MNERGFSTSAIVVGLLFAALGVVFLLDSLDAWEPRLDVLLAAVAIALGAMLIFAAFRRGAE